MENFEFDLQLKAVISKAFRVLGLIIRSSGKLKCETLVYLYKKLVRFILLYNSQIWSPHYNSHCKLLESVQHKFFRYLAYKQGISFSFDNHDYSKFSRNIKLCSIKSLHELLFVRKVLSFTMPSMGDSLVSLFPSRENKFNTRNHRELLEVSSSKDYIFHSSSFRLKRCWNSLYSGIRLCVKMCNFKSELFENICKYE